MKVIEAFCICLIGFILVLLPAHAVENRHAIAVIIGNKTYPGKIPAVDYAHNDAEAFKHYVIDVLGYREGNIIELRDATLADFRNVFGDDRNFEGKLFDWMRPGKSDVTVFYSGHGVPGLEDRNGYLLPVDGDASKAEMTGYPIELLYKNLSKIPANSATVFLDTCFSGETPKGLVIHGTSGLTVTPNPAKVPTKLTVMTAARGDQLANWDEEAKHGLFTEHLLRALYGKADENEFGNGDGNVTLAEVRGYLNDEMSYQARRQTGRKQTSTVMGSDETIMAAFVGGNIPKRPDLDLSPPTSPDADNIITMDDTLYAQKNLNVRKEPSAKSAKVSRIKKGASVTVVGEVKDTNWYLIEEEGESIGYVYGDLLADDPPRMASLVAPSRPAAPPSAKVFHVSPVRYDGREFPFASDIIHRALSGIPNSRVSRGETANTSDAVVTAAVIRFDTQQINNPDYAGAQIANQIFGGLLKGITQNIKPFFTIYDVEVMVNSKDGSSGAVITATGRSMVKVMDYVNQNMAAMQAIKQAFSDGAGRLVIRLSGGVPPAWQPPELIPKKKKTEEPDPNP